MVDETSLSDFLLARIAEDEADARAAVDDDPNWLHLRDGRIIQGDAGFAVSSGWLELPHRHEAGDHIARHDPARVLAECEAKRRIVAAHNDGTAWCDHCGGCGANTHCPTIAALLLPYADHPAYRDEWTP